MSLEEIEILKQRAEKFLKNAEYLFNTGIYDLSAFNAQQAVELYLKYKLFILVGDYPKTHSIKKLLKEIGKIWDENKVREFMLSNIDAISNLENAYITTRYIPTEFEREEVENLLKLARKIITFVGAI